MKIGERIRARVVERSGQQPIVTKVDDVHDDHGPGQFVVLEWGEDGYFEVERFGSVYTNEQGYKMNLSTYNDSNPDHVAKFMPDGSTEHGRFLLCEDRILRFYTHAEIRNMTPLGQRSQVGVYSCYVMENIQ